MSETTSGAVLSAYPTCQLRSHRFEALAPGPRLIVLGAVHGNEVCGARGIERVVAEFDAGTLQLARGVVTLLPVTNPLAYLKVQRNGERNLNRNLRPSDNPQDYEDQIANRLCPMLAGMTCYWICTRFRPNRKPLP
jgi:predicted deacylase